MLYPTDITMISYLMGSNDYVLKPVSFHASSTLPSSQALIRVCGPRTISNQTISSAPNNSLERTGDAVRKACKVVRIASYQAMQLTAPMPDLMTLVLDRASAHKLREHRVTSPNLLNTNELGEGR